MQRNPSPDDFKWRVGARGRRAGCARSPRTGRQALRRHDDQRRVLPDHLLRLPQDLFPRIRGQDRHQGEFHHAGLPSLQPAHRPRTVDQGFGARRGQRHLHLFRPLDRRRLADQPRQIHQRRQDDPGRLGAGGFRRRPAIGDAERQGRDLRLRLARRRHDPGRRALRPDREGGTFHAQDLRRADQSVRRDPQQGRGRSLHRRQAASLELDSLFDGHGRRGVQGAARQSRRQRSTRRRPPPRPSGTRTC